MKPLVEFFSSIDGVLASLVFALPFAYIAVIEGELGFEWMLVLAVGVIATANVRQIRLEWEA